MAHLSSDQLHRLLRYEPETGKLFWRPRTPDQFTDGKHTAIHTCNWWNARFAGKEAGASNSDGYLQFGYENALIKNHCAIWAMQTGVWPEDEIDHGDGDPSNNRFINLTSGTRQDNMRNRPVTRASTSGVMGVTWDKAYQLWQANIGVDGKLLHLGRFKKLEDAAAARKAAELLHGFHINHGRKPRELS